MTAGAPASGPESSRAPSKLKLLFAAVFPAWGRIVVVIIGAAVVANAAGLGKETGFALIPGVYMVMTPLVGDFLTRVLTVLSATVLIAGAALLGAWLAGTTAAVTVGLLVVGFAAGLLPRFGPRAASMQLPLMMAFAYSAAFTLSAGSAGDRVAAVFVTMPVYLLAAAVLFQTDGRRPLMLGAAAGFEGVQAGLEEIATDGGADETSGSRFAELGVIRFRVAAGRMKDAAMPYGNGLEDRATRLLTVAVQQAVTGVGLLARENAQTTAARRERLAAMAITAGGLVAALKGAGPTPDPRSTRALADEMHAEDAGGALLGDALADGAGAVAVLRHETRGLPAGATTELPGWRSRLQGVLTPEDPTFRRAVRLAAAAGTAGLTAGLLGLTRTYWAVFAVVVVLNAPAASDWRRGLMRIAGTAGGFVLALGLVALVGHHSALAIAIGLVLLLPGVMLMAVNYGAGVVFVTCAVAMFYSAIGEESDFLGFRLLDNAVGVAVVCAVGLLLWRSSSDDWWRVARLTACSLAVAIVSQDRTRYRDELITRGLQLRAQTVETAAIPDIGASFAAAWLYGAAAQDLTSALVGARPQVDERDDPAALAARLRALEAWSATGPSSRSHFSLQSAPEPMTRAGLDITRMETAVAVLGREQRRQADEAASAGISAGG